MVVQVIINLHHIKHGSVHDHKTAFSEKLFILGPHGHRKLLHSRFRNIGSRFDTKESITKRKQEGKSTKIVALRKVSTHSTRHLPVFSFSLLRKSLLICEEVRITFHRNAETLSQNIVSCCRSFLSSFHIKLIGFIANGLS